MKKKIKTIIFLIVSTVVFVILHNAVFALFGYEDLVLFILSLAFGLITVAYVVYCVVAGIIKFFVNLYE